MSSLQELCKRLVLFRAVADMIGDRKIRFLTQWFHPCLLGQYQLKVFFLAVRLHVLYLSFVNPFFSCLNGMYPS